jgi:membrane associated rhomboid family serine protease
MFPLRDNIPPRTIPWVNYSIIAICSLVFFVQYLSGPSGDRIVERWGLVPARLANASESAFIPTAIIEATPMGDQVVMGTREVLPAAVPDWLTILTCMFLHGGLMHCFGNLWFLHIFGDNVEDRLGHWMYAAMYLAAGVIAGLTHFLSDMQSPIPTIGASGAIAGVMGAYMLLYPAARITAVIPMMVAFPMIVVPAPAFLGIWFAMQFVQGASAASSGQSGGVAWFAHIGGFVAGVLVAFVLNALNRTSPAVEELRPGTERLGIMRSNE